MIPMASGVKVWIATGHTDMRRGMNSLALLVQEAFKCNPHLCVGRRYVAAPSRSEQFRGFDEFCRHIIFDDSPPTQDRPGHRQRGDFDVGFVFQI